MAENVKNTKAPFLGFKQVTSTVYNQAVQDNAVDGYLWFVRTVAGDDEIALDIYMGSQKYAHTEETVFEAIVDNAITDVDITGNFMSFKNGEGTEVKSLDISNLLKVLQDVEVIGEAGNKQIQFTWTNGQTDTINVNDLIPVKIPVTNCVVDADIIVEGGPLAELAKNSFTDGKISSGTTIQALLTTLFCKEEYPDAQTNTASTFTSKVSATPSISVKNGTNPVSNNALCEVNTVLTFGGYTAATISNSATAPKATGMTNGYKTSLTATTAETGTSIAASWSFTEKTDTTHSLAVSTSMYSGTTPTSTTSETVSALTISGCNLKVQYGTNTYTITQTGRPVIGSHNGLASVYYLSNLKNVNNNEKTTAVDAATGITATTPSTAATHTVKGVYPIYAKARGIIDNPTDLGNIDKNTPTAVTQHTTIKYPLIEVGTTDKYVYYYFVKNSVVGAWEVYLPDSYKITQSAYLDTLTNTWDETWNAFTKVENAKQSLSVGGTSVDYNVWSANNNFGDLAVRIAIQKV